MKVPLVRAVVAVTHFVGFEEEGCKVEEAQVRQVPEGEEQEEQEGSQAVRNTHDVDYLISFFRSKEESEGKKKGEQRTETIPPAAHVVPLRTSSALRPIRGASPARVAGARSGGGGRGADTVGAVASACSTRTRSVSQKRLEKEREGRIRRTR